MQAHYAVGDTEADAATTGLRREERRKDSRQ